LAIIPSLREFCSGDMNISVSYYPPPSEEEEVHRQVQARCAYCDKPEVSKAFLPASWLLASYQYYAHASEN
jgi:hypothetical protein